MIYSTFQGCGDLLTSMVFTAPGPYTVSTFIVSASPERLRNEVPRVLLARFLSLPSTAVDLRVSSRHAKRALHVFALRLLGGGALSSSSERRLPPARRSRDSSRRFAGTVPAWSHRATAPGVSRRDPRVLSRPAKRAARVIASRLVGDATPRDGSAGKVRAWCRRARSRSGSQGGNGFMRLSAHVPR